MCSVVRRLAANPVLRKLAANPALRTSLTVALVSSCVLLSFRALNPGHGAEHYYARTNVVLYRIMQLCNVVVVTSLAFHLRHAVGLVIGALEL